MVKRPDVEANAYIVRAHPLGLEIRQSQALSLVNGHVDAPLDILVGFQS